MGNSVPLPASVSLCRYPSMFTDRSVRGSSSSVIVRAAPATGTAVVVPETSYEAFPVMVVARSGSSAPLSRVVTWTRSALVVAPAGRRIALSATSKTPVRASSDTVMSECHTPESVADTCVEPSRSGIVEGDADRVTVGAPSSSTRVSRAPVTVPMPTEFTAEAPTVSIRSASSVRLSTAVRVTVSEESEVLPRGMVIVASLPTVNAPATAETVSVVAASEAPLRAADTSVVPPFSEMELADSERVTVGVSSSSAVETDTSRGACRA